MTLHFAFSLALFAAALGCALFAATTLTRAARLRRSASVLDRALARQASTAAADDPRATPARIRQWLVALVDAGTRWLNTRIGTVVVAAEDRKLLERCGYMHADARARFFLARLTGATVLPALVSVFCSASALGSRFTFLLFASLVAGFLAPKWFVRQKAMARQRAMTAELPMFIDLLRILQGVGLSLDQSLVVMIDEFSKVLPLLTKEFSLAQSQYATGRTREQAMKRLSTTFDNDDLTAVTRLLVQIDQHGGAVQEPLRQFGDRLRETRRTALRERIGKLTVKMTGVMVLTLLPALLIMTAGPGFISVFHSLGGLHR